MAQYGSNMDWMMGAWGIGYVRSIEKASGPGAQLQCGERMAGGRTQHKQERVQG